MGEDADDRERDRDGEDAHDERKQCGHERAESENENDQRERKEFLLALAAVPRHRRGHGRAFRAGSQA